MVCERICEQFQKFCTMCLTSSCVRVHEPAPRWSGTELNFHKCTLSSSAQPCSFLVSALCASRGQRSSLSPRIWQARYLPVKKDSPRYRNDVLHNTLHVSKGREMVYNGHCKKKKGFMMQHISSACSYGNNTNAIGLR